MHGIKSLKDGKEIGPKKANNEVDKYVWKFCYKTQYLVHNTHQTGLIRNFTFLITVGHGDIIVRT
jgi:hypothetical protein